MKHYPVVIHKDRKSVFGVIIPDLPGCFSAGATLDEALRNVQEAVEVHLRGEDIAPEPSALDRWKADPDYRDAYALALAPVDLSFMNDATVRVNITARKSELAIVDRAAKRAHMDRSAYLVLSAIERAKAALDRSVTPGLREGEAVAGRTKGVKRKTAAGPKAMAKK
ncbi:MAG TPA: type II toxin-antitoxin system HicB family antitoxin [Usitatibacteraceae bacterium]